MAYSTQKRRHRCSYILPSCLQIVARGGSAAIAVTCLRRVWFPPRRVCQLHFFLLFCLPLDNTKYVEVDAIADTVTNIYAELRNMAVITGPNDDKSVHQSVLMTPRDRTIVLANAVDFILREHTHKCDRMEEGICLGCVWLRRTEILGILHQQYLAFSEYSWCLWAVRPQLLYIESSVLLSCEPSWYTFSMHNLPTQF